MKNIAIFLFFLISFASFVYSQVESEIKTYTIGDFILTKNYILEEYKLFNPNTGAVQTNYNTIFSISIKNTKTPKSGVFLYQDVSFIPTTMKINFDLSPQNSSGNYIIWNFGLIDKDQEVKIKMVVNGNVPKEKFLSQISTTIKYNPPSLILDAPLEGIKGEVIEITLKDMQNNPLRNLKVDVITPDGARLSYYTDQNGKIKFLAQSTGFYSYEVSGYEIGKKYTQILETSTIKEQPNNTQAQTSTPQEQKSEDIFGFIFNILSWVVGIGILIALIYFIYQLYKQFKSTQKAGTEEEVYIPPAGSYPQTTIKEEDTQADLIRDVKEKISRPILSSKTTKEEELKEEQVEEELDEDSFEEQSALLLKKRRVGKVLESSSIQEEQELKEDQEAFIADDYTQDEYTKEEELKEEEEYKKVQKEEEFDEEIDEDAIKKTIAELEQLREELKRKQESVERLAPESAYEQENIQVPPIEKEKKRKYEPKIKEKQTEQLEQESNYETQIEKEVNALLEKLDQEEKTTKKTKKSSKKQKTKKRK
jgi:hypothetical protein